MFVLVTIHNGGALLLNARYDWLYSTQCKLDNKVYKIKAVLISRDSAYGSIISFLIQSFMSFPKQVHI